MTGRPLPWVIATFVLSCGIGSASAQEPAAPAQAATVPAKTAPAAPEAPEAKPTSQVTAIVEKQPYELVRSMHALQDQMVLGNYAAQAALPKLSNRIAEKLLAAPAEVWRDPRNARAVASYVLGGGQARVGHKVLDSGTVPEFEHRLIEGAVDYVEGRQAKARPLLMEVDARRLQGPLGGHVAFVQAALAPQAEPAKIRRFLDMARLLAPGTLIEEAALRREIVLVDEMTDVESFILLASQYERRFRKSVYADNFRQRFAASLLRLGLLSDVAHFARVDKLLADVQPDQERLDIYLLIAQTALIKGNTTVARMAADRATAMSKTTTVDGTRSALYAATAQLLTDGFDDGFAKLNGLDLEHLPKRDSELAHAAVTIARQIRSWPTDADIADLDVSKASAPAPLPPEAKAAAVLDLEQKALSETDELLRK